MYLFFDTETTGFPSNTLEARDPKQGRACQVAFILSNEEGRPLAAFQSLILPDGWKITDGARGVHGLDDEMCMTHGMKSKMTFQVFQRFAAKADVLVAHNIDFDLKIMNIEAKAHGLEMPEFEHQQCTMKASTDLCKIPKKRGSGYKWPKLEEALDILMGKKLDGDAHDAMVDTRGCQDLYFYLKEKGAL